MSLEKLLKEMKEKPIGRRELLFSFLGAVGFYVSGCALNMPGPGGRIGCLPSPNNPLTEDLGENAANCERGIAFTKLYGHIDIAHVRKYGEWVEYLASRLNVIFNGGKVEFVFSGKEPVEYAVKINYPSNWNSAREEKKEIIENVSTELAAYLSHKTSIMHETLTWFRWRSTIIIPEYSSAFSWEDLPSDVFGVYVGKHAMQDKTRSFKEAMAVILKSELDRLEIQSRKVSIEAAKSVEGKWYKGYGLGSQMLMRNLDIGTGDGKVGPCIPPGYGREDGRIWECPIPNLEYSGEMGFDFQLEARPHVKKEVFQRILGKDIIDPETDFPIMMEYIKREAVEKGYIVDN